MTLHDEIAEEIKSSGVIPFNRFMELALYHPKLGFYASGGAGRRQDFITSPETGPLFGKLIANALDQWWRELGTPDPFYFIDAGAGTGTLAKSILRAEPSCRDALRYLAIEISDLQRSQHPDHVESFERLPESVDTGIIFANELLDNLPFNIYQSDNNGNWLQVCVGLSGGSFHEVLAECDPDQIKEFVVPEKAGIRIPDQIEARRWVSKALDSIQSGRIVVIDYALHSFPAPEGHQWLRTYRSHGYGENPLEAPGSQDITTDVDIHQLSRVQQPDSIQSQQSWLKSLGIDALVKEGIQIWNKNAASPDVDALEARSRRTEAKALLDKRGLGGFQVIQWSITH